MSGARHTFRGAFRTLWIPEVVSFLLGCIITCGVTTVIFHCSHRPEKPSCFGSPTPSHVYPVQTRTLDSLREEPLDQWSPSLAQIVREVVIPPSKLPYNLVNGNRDPSYGQAQLIKKLFRGKVGSQCNYPKEGKIINQTFFQRNGFFIEAGALDGELLSNTLSLEKDLGWSGLLAEGDPSSVEKVRYDRQFIILGCVIDHGVIRAFHFCPGQNKEKVSCCLTASLYREKPRS